MSAHLLIRSVPAMLLLSLVGCSTPEPPAPPKADILAVTPAPTPTTCQASSSWITAPTQPSEVASTESFCDFYQFSWQWFLAQVSPSSDPAGDRVFETNRVVDTSGGKDQCSATAIRGRAKAATLLAARLAKPIDFETEEADGNPLYDQANNVLYFNIWYSDAECQATAAGFAPGTMEIKTAWRILPAADSTYYMMDASVPDASGGNQNVILGMVGFHLVNWTSAHPEMIWASFEHKTNAPLCDGSSATSGWSLASDAAAQCLADNPQSSGGTISANCASYNFNTPPPAGTNPPPATGTPNNICRLYANGNQPGTAINGNDNAANLAAIVELNDALVGSGGMLTALPDTDPMAVWKNYEMVGGLWTKGGASSGNLPIPNAGGAADPTSPQRGSLELTNMTMETYQQGAASFIPNCFGCHGFSTSTPLTVSHIATKFLLPSTVTAKQAAEAHAMIAAARAARVETK